MTYSHTDEASPASLTISTCDKTIYNWRRQDRIDRGIQAGVSSHDRVELTAAKKRISDLEAELAIAQRAVDILREETSPQAGTRRSK